MKHELTDSLNDLSASMVKEYLLENSDFFIRHPELLLSLRIPHTERGTVSLIEHQQLNLRSRVQQLEEEITSLLSVASRNEDIYRFYNQLFFDLLNTHSLDEINRVLVDSFKSRFRFAKVRLAITDLQGQFEQPELNLILRRRLNEQGYYLGRLPAQEQNPLVAQDNGSVALVCIGDRSQPVALLAIASNDPSHFSPDMDTMMLDQVRQLLAYKIPQLLHG
ncbi:hypothetical protein SAMN04488540_101158 [Ferrimonas sediminum]|uniref:DUF484 domain-containing protein n=1 Tax=Ferrimonas sediminum TaxID=718193 RepID=A0A1G8JTS3_9GAMM|nr:DUF484 family protein [Ferrimonas sediminum]SDI34629.1 hypothetical protein SAMN04488540_101158 [Ferrimonas sediminum]